MPKPSFGLTVAADMPAALFVPLKKTLAQALDNAYKAGLAGEPPVPPVITVPPSTPAATVEALSVAVEQGITKAYAAGRADRRKGVKR